MGSLVEDFTKEHFLYGIVILLIFISLDVLGSEIHVAVVIVSNKGLLVHLHPTSFYFFQSLPTGYIIHVIGFQALYGKYVGDISCRAVSPSANFPRAHPFQEFLSRGLFLHLKACGGILTGKFAIGIQGYDEGIPVSVDQRVKINCGRTGIDVLLLLRLVHPHDPVQFIFHEFELVVLIGSVIGQREDADKINDITGDRCGYSVHGFSVQYLPSGILYKPRFVFLDCHGLLRMVTATAFTAAAGILALRADVFAASCEGRHGYCQYE